MIKRILKLYIILIILFILSGASAFADTLLLNDGTVLVGKIFIEDEDKILFKNSYGIFSVKKNDIIKTFVTKDYNEDVNIHKKLGKEFDVEDVKKDFNAGMDRGPIGQDEEYSDSVIEYETRTPWKSGRMFLNGLFLRTTGRLEDKVTYGYGGMLSLDQGLDSIYGLIKNYLPGGQIEFGYLYYKKDKAKIDMISMAIGPKWMLSVFGDQYGRFSISGTIGISYLNIENEVTLLTYDSDTSSYIEVGTAVEKESNYTLTSSGTIGYEYNYNPLIFTLHAKYMYVFDERVDLHSIGLLAGVGMKLWDM